MYNKDKMKIIDSMLKDKHYVSSPYGERDAITLPDGKVYPASFHKGTDYGTSGKKIPVYAPCDIKVTKVDETKGSGKRIFFTLNGGDKVKIQHLYNTNVKTGEYKKDSILGNVGMSGTYSTGVHLHLEVFVNDENVDPEKYNFIESNEENKDKFIPDNTQNKNTNGELFKKGDKVIPIELINYDGKKIKMYDKSYEILEFNRDEYQRVVLVAIRNGKKSIWSAMHIDNIKKI